MRVWSFVLGHLSTNLRTLLLTQSDSRERKERITKSFIGSWENTDRAKNQSYHRMYYRALWEKKNYHLTKSENSLQNSDNLMQLKSVLDILPWHRNRHLIEYHIKCDSQYKLWIVLENFQATNFNQNLNALWLSCLHLVRKQFFPFQGRLSSGKNIIIAISCGVLSSLFSGSIQARMYWLFRNLRFLFLASTMEFVTANDQCRTEVNIQGVALKKDGQWRLLIFAMSNVDKRSRAKAITTTENTKYVN